MGLTPHEALADVEFASRISVAACEHGGVHVQLHRDDGSIFAAGGLDPTGARNVAALLQRKADEAESVGGPH